MFDFPGELFEVFGFFIHFIFEGDDLLEIFNATRTVVNTSSDLDEVAPVKIFFSFPSFFKLPYRLLVFFCYLQLFLVEHSPLIL